MWNIILTFVVFHGLLFHSCEGLHMQRFSRQQVLKPFHEGKALKIISGILNFNEEKVEQVVRSAYLGGASHVDIASNPKLVQLAKQSSHNQLPICVSSIQPQEFVACVEAGADMIEIGNYDGFYGQKIDFSMSKILELTKETRALLPNIPLSVTIPHILTLSDQILLAKELESLSVDILQTEGKMSIDRNQLSLEEVMAKAIPTLSSAYSLSKVVKIPILCASGLTDVTAPLALAAGAKGVGIGSMVNRLNSLSEMILAVQQIANAMGRTNNLSTGYITTNEKEDIHKKSFQINV